MAKAETLFKTSLKVNNAKSGQKDASRRNRYSSSVDLGSNFSMWPSNFNSNKSPLPQPSDSRRSSALSGYSMAVPTVVAAYERRIQNPEDELQSIERRSSSQSKQLKRSVSSFQGQMTNKASLEPTKKEHVLKPRRHTVFFAGNNGGRDERILPKSYRRQQSLFDVNTRKTARSQSASPLPGILRQRSNSPLANDVKPSDERGIGSRKEPTVSFISFSEKSLPEIHETDEPHRRLSNIPYRQSSSVRSLKAVHSMKESEASLWRYFVDCFCGSLLQFQNKAYDGDTELLKNESTVDYHKIGVPQFCARLQTDVRYGLTEAAVRVRVDTYGPNRIRPPPSLPRWLRFCKNLVDGFCILLWIGAFLCFLAYGMQKSKGEEVPNDNLYVGFVLIGVILITAAFSYYQEAKAFKIMESFEKFMPWQTSVVRAGREMQVSAEQLVPGDVVLLKAGDKVPADCRVIKAVHFKVDTSCITGESEPQVRTPDCSDDNPLESRNMIFFSTFAVEGSATAIVVGTGDHTVIGRMARLTTGLKQNPSPIAKELDIFVYIIYVFAAFLGIIILIWFLVLNPEKWIEAVVLFIGIVIGVYPSGVLIEVAVCLTLAAQRMAKQNAIVKNLEAVETLGSTTTICSDKTGTLTMNQMTVSHLWFNNEIHVADVSNDQIIGGRNYKTDSENTGWASLIRIAALCSRAVFKPGQDNVDVMQRECIGSGTEAGLLKFAERSIGYVEEFRKTWPKLAEVAFSSATKFQASVHLRREDGRFIVVMKGAPEKVIEMCSTIYVKGRDEPITAAVKAHFNEVYDELAEKGERVLGFAELLLPVERFPMNFRFTVDLTPNFPTAGLRFIGLIAMMDPPRPAVPDAVRKCREAGIRVAMVTGDHPITAKSIARMVGVIGPNSKTREEIAKELAIPLWCVDPKEPNAIVISGNQLRDMSNKELDIIIARYKEIVFARTSPQQKLFIVEGFQRAGDIVAVTGDGVSDSPALKQADIGIAMGMSGSDISKQGADMILMDDNFATIVFAIEDGRKMFDNLKKTVCYILAGNETEIAAPLAAVALGIPLPMSTIAMLVLSLLTDLVQAVMLAYEEAEADVMKRKPREAKADWLVNKRLIFVSMGMYGVIEVCAGFFAYFVVLAESGFLPQAAWNLGNRFDDPGCNNLIDSYGQEWTYEQRKHLQYTLFSAYLLAVVEMQCINVLACKASRSHLFQQSWRNHYLYLGLVTEACIVAFLCYCPGVNNAFGLAPLLGCWWLIALPWGLLLVAVDQLRKYLIRSSRTADSFGSREMLY